MKRITLFFMLAAFSHTAMGQMFFGIAELPNFETKKTIVRAVDDDCSLIYAFDKTVSQGLFILHVHSSGSAQFFYIPQKLEVMDMEINGGSVYFCGNECSNHAFVGQFDIPGRFAGTAPFQYCLIPLATPYDVEMNTATRMTTMKLGSLVYILGIGDATHDYTEPVPYIASTLFSAAMAPSVCLFYVDYQKAHHYIYTDIDCSDNYVAFTGIDSNSDAHIFITGQAPAFFSSPYYPVAYNLGIPVEDYQLLLKAKNGDKFTVVCLPQWRTRVDLMEVPVPMPTFLTLYSTQNSSSSSYMSDHWVLHELRHDDVSDHPLLLGMMALPPHDVFGNWITEFDWGNTLSQTNPWGLNFCSLDGVSGTMNYVVTDEQIVNISLGKESFILPSTSCFIQKNVTILQSRIYPIIDESDHRESQCNDYYDSSWPEIYNIETITICE